MHIQSIEAELETLDGFKKIFTGIFGTAKAKKAFAIYQDAEKKGVYDNICLREEVLKDARYSIFGFSFDETIPKESIEVIQNRAKKLHLGTITCESQNYSTMSQYPSRDCYAIGTVVKDIPNFIMYPTVKTNSKSNEIQMPAVIYAFYKGVHYLYPLSEKVYTKLMGSSKEHSNLY